MTQQTPNPEIKKWVKFSFSGMSVFAVRWQLSCPYYKCFTIVFYNRNDIGLYYKTRDDRN